MKRLAAFVLALAMSAAVRGQEVPAENRFAPLDTLLDRYYEAVLYFEPEDKCAEMDRLIVTASDSLARQYVAVSIFNHYKESPVMGEETVAVHIFDKWFADGSVPMRSMYEKIDAQLFADINRNSLIGCDAPHLIAFNRRGREVALPSEGRVSVLFFYDASCSKCRMDVKLFPSVFRDVGYDVDFYAFYVGDDRRAWRKFRNSLHMKNPHVNVVHLWDPEHKTDYLRLYGVVSTPKMYLVEPQGMIIGRRLEVDNLAELLPVAGAVKTLYDRFVNK